MTTNPELLPCPKCQSDNVEMDSRRGFIAYDGKHSTACAIYCNACGIELSMCYRDFTGYEHEEVIAMVVNNWNTRTPDTLSQKQVHKKFETGLQLFNEWCGYSYEWSALTVIEQVRWGRLAKKLSASEGALSPASGDLTKGGGVSMKDPSGFDPKDALTSPETPSGASRGEIPELQRLKDLQNDAVVRFKHSLLQWLREQVRSQSELARGCESMVREDRAVCHRVSSNTFQQVIDHIENEKGDGK